MKRTVRQVKKERRGLENKQAATLEGECLELKGCYKSSWGWGQSWLVAVARRVQVAEHTLRRHRVPPYMQDDLAFPATLPSADV
jgi:hypothetical protein